MMRRTEGRTIFTRLRWIACMLVFFALAVCTALWWPQSIPVPDVKVKFVRFETSDDGGSVDYALVTVHNDSSRKWSLLAAREWLPLKGEMFQALGRLATTDTRIESGSVPRRYMGGGISHTLKTNATEHIAVALPRMGEKGWVEVFCWTPPNTRRGLPGIVQQWWWRIRPPKSFWMWVRCEAPIQCGRERPYGNPVPPSVISQEAKPPL